MAFSWKGLFRRCAWSHGYHHAVSGLYTAYRHPVAPSNGVIIISISQRIWTLQPVAELNNLQNNLV